ncbi:MAG TPA: ABC transporter permease [Gemmatimonadaceae bacterium]|nr:ABC transporter permease [Gemmatimonadaceae bacterium]
MRVPAGIRRALRLPMTSERLLRELDEEVRFHVEMRAQRLMERGAKRDDAYAEALQRFGDLNELRDYCQTIEVTHMRRVEWRARAAGLLQDVRYAQRQFRNAPGFSAIAAITLALGIGATTAIFSVVSGVLLKPLPYHEPDRIVQLWGLDSKGNHLNFADPTFDDVVARNRSFSAVAEYSSFGSTFVVNGEAVVARAAVVSRDFFDVFSLRPAAGRFFVGEERQLGAAPAAVISYAFWQRQYGGSRSVLSGGAALTSNGKTVHVVGVLAEGLEFPAGTDVYIPREINPKNTSRTAHNFHVVARLAPGVSLTQARQDLSTILRRIKSQVGDYTWTVDGTAVPLNEELVGKIRPMLLLIFGASTMLLLIACANVLNLLVARIAARESELAVRIALGAGRGRLAQQLLVESVVLAVVGCAGGLLLAGLGVRTLAAFQPASIPRVGDVAVDWRVLLFAIGTSAVAAMALGLIAAWRGVSGDLRSALAHSQRTQGGGGASYRVRGTLVVVQLAMTMVLLAGAAVLGRSFINLMTVDAGFRTRGIVVANMLLSREDLSPASLARRNQFIDEALERLGGLPGVTSVGGVDDLPLSGANGNGTFLVLDNAAVTIRMSDLERLFQDKTRTGSASYDMASGSYFQTMGIPVIAGRVFDDRDRPDAPHVAIVNQALAKKQWPGESAIGKVIEFGNMDGDLTPMTIVGVVGDVRDRALSSPPSSIVYTDYRQRPGNGGSFSIVMSTSTPGSVITSARQILGQLRPDVPIRFSNVESLVSRSVAQQRFMLFLVGTFGLISLLLAALGVYSVISYLVAQRNREMSIRVALGARGADVVRLVVGQGVVLVLVGALIGTAGAMLATRLLKGMVYETSTTDPAGFGAVIVLLCVIAVAASYVPARRAARVDPMNVLRGG